MRGRAAPAGRGHRHSWRLAIGMAIALGGLNSAAAGNTTIPAADETLSMVDPQTLTPAGPS